MSTHSSIVRTLRVSTLNVCEVHSCLHMCGVSHDPGDQKEIYIVMVLACDHNAMMAVVCLSVCVSRSVCLTVCLSVPWLTLSRERNCIDSWNLAARKLMTDHMTSFTGQRSSSLGLWNSKFCYFYLYLLMTGWEVRWTLIAPFLVQPILEWIHSVCLDHMRR